MVVPLFSCFCVCFVCVYACVVFASFGRCDEFIMCECVHVLYAYVEALVTTPPLFVMEPCTYVRLCVSMSGMAAL